MSAKYLVKFKGAGAKRARHNSSLLDAHILKSGEEPEDMPESYVIFITQSDVMGKGKSVYKIGRYVDMDDEKVLFGDGSHRQSHQSNNYRQR